MLARPCAGGDPHLGGDDWDAAIVEWLVTNHMRPAGVDHTDPAVASRLKVVLGGKAVGSGEWSRLQGTSSMQCLQEPQVMHCSSGSSSASMQCLPEPQVYALW